ncbi:MAG: hypothetical protein NWE98_09550 [Candidatus Bathyarchaeota archaeon]|nr:hypothetical protein [Candidatus Bathyarchaeota archaeon]
MDKRTVGAVCIFMLLFFALVSFFHPDFAAANPVVPGAFWGVPQASVFTIKSPMPNAVLTSNSVVVAFDIPILAQFTYETVTAQVTSIHYTVESLNVSGNIWQKYLEGDASPKPGLIEVLLTLPEGNFNVSVTASWSGSYQA